MLQSVMLIKVYLVFEEINRQMHVAYTSPHNCFVVVSWRYNPLWLYFHSPVAGFSLLVFEVS
jgi:hypothetical protein